MPKKTSPLILGDFWLDKRRDGKSPGVWQIAYVKNGTNSITYKSTKKRDLESAKRAIQNFAKSAASGKPSILLPKPPDPLDVKVIPQLYRYWEVRGEEAFSSKTIARHLCEFKAFLEGDNAGSRATFSDLTKELWQRYFLWVLKPHSYSVEWYGTTINARSSGVCGATLRRSLASVKAALNLAVEDRIVPHLWRVPALPPELRSPPQMRVLSMEEVGAMIGYAADDTPLLNWILIMLGTAVRPTAALKLVPNEQWDEQTRRLNLQPRNAPRTDKRNPRVPLPPQLEELIRRHDGPWIPCHVKHETLNRRWRLMREALGFAAEVVPKSLRRTVATMLTEACSSNLHIEMLLGHHIPQSWRDREVFSPRYYNGVVPTLMAMWDEAHREAARWRDRYTIVRTAKGAKLVLTREQASLVAENNLTLQSYHAVSPALMRADRQPPDLHTGHGCGERERALAAEKVSQYWRERGRRGWKKGNDRP